MSDQPEDDAVSALTEALESRGLDQSTGLFTREEFQQIVQGRRVARLDVLDDVVVDFLSAAQAFALPQRAGHADDQARILDRWAPTLDALDAMRPISVGLGLRIDAIAEELAADGGYQANKALSQLFWGAHIVVSEIITLLRHGPPAGALARWRALYEMGVRSAAIAEAGLDLGQRFLVHELLRHSAEDRRWWTDVDRDRPLDESDTVTEVERLRTELIKQHGGSRPDLFMTEYGWAHDYLCASYPSYEKAFRKGDKSKGPTLIDLSRGVYQSLPSKAEREIYYSRASAAIHGSPRSLGEYDDNGLTIGDAATMSSFGLAIDQTSEDIGVLTYNYLLDVLDPDEEGGPTLLILCVWRLCDLVQRRALAAGSEPLD